MSAIKNDFQNTRSHKVRRFVLIIGITAFHLTCYYAVKLFNSQYLSSELWNFHTIFDDWIPYLGWTWIIYYLGDLYILPLAAIIVWKLPDLKFRRAVSTYTGMIIAGALLQIAVPAKSPWPENMTYVQKWFHDTISINPYACLPSMHVALTVLPGLISFSVFKSIWIMIFLAILAILVTISTVTLKEHYFLDAIAGVILAFIFYGFWRWDLKNFLRKHLKKGSHGNTKRKTI